MVATPRITRVKARKTTADTHQMPSMERLFGKYKALLGVDGGIGRLIDPFARNCSWCSPFTNDLNPETDAQDHLDAEDYIDTISDAGHTFALAILDPPFSNRQASEIYGTPNLYASDSAKMVRIGRKLGNMIEPGGYIIKAGYNTNPFHPSFELIEVRMVHHGGNCNDTIFSVWQNVNRNLEEWCE